MSHGICDRCGTPDRTIARERWRCTHPYLETCRSKSAENMSTVTHWCMPSHCKVRFQCQFRWRKNLCMFIIYSIMYFLGFNWGCNHKGSWVFPGWIGDWRRTRTIEVTRSVSLSRIFCFLSPMVRRWGSKSSMVLESDVVLRFPGRVTMPPGGVRPSGGSAVARLFKGSMWFSSRIAKCFTWAGFRGTGFGASNDRLGQKSVNEYTSPLSHKELEVKGAPRIVDEPQLKLREYLASPSSCGGEWERMNKSDRMCLEWAGCESTPRGRGLSVHRISLECKWEVKMVWIYMFFNECKMMEWLELS